MGIAKSPPQEQKTTILHGTAVQLQSPHFEPAAVLLRGMSGSGKSDLAGRLIDAGGALICDDQVGLERRQDKVFADSVDTIRGLLEVRGVGLLTFPVADATRLRLVVDLVKKEEVPRLPEWGEVDILGVSIPRIKLCAFEISAALKVMRAMEVVHDPSIVVK